MKLGALSALAAAGGVRARPGPHPLVGPPFPGGARGPVTLFLCGDVMTGRGIDQILPHPNDPRIHERHLTSATAYVELAETANGPIERPVSFAYPWGDALDELRRVAPAARIINLETAVTRHAKPAPKGIHYRMHPANAPMLEAAEVDCAVLANNHVLDWGEAGLLETLETLENAGIAAAGAGRDRAAAGRPAILETGGGSRVLVSAFGHPTSGIPRHWAATPARAGIAVLDELTIWTVEAMAERILPTKRPGDIVVASLHWGDNWGYDIPARQRAFAHRLIDRAGVDLVHGHSSHHVKGIEVYRDRLILYGCGDFLNDYEGIHGNERYRAELGLMYFPAIDPANGRLLGLEMTPTRIRNLRVNRASAAESAWLAGVLNREGRQFGTSVVPGPDHRLSLRWN